MAAGAGVSLKRENHFLAVTELTDKTFGLTQLKNTIETRTVKHSQTLAMYVLFYLWESTYNTMHITVSAAVWWCIVHYVCVCVYMYMYMYMYICVCVHPNNSWTNLTYVYVSDSRLHQCFRYGTELTLFYPDEVMH